MIGLGNVGYYKLLSKRIAIHRKLQSSDSRPMKTALILYFFPIPSTKRGQHSGNLIQVYLPAHDAKRSLV